MSARRLLVGMLMVLVWVVPLVAAAGCSGGSGGGGSLEGPTWYLESYRAEDGDTAPVLPDVPVTASFDGDTVSGSGGVNEYSAAYSVDGSAISIEDIGSTFMAGSEPAMAQEAAYFQALGDAESFEVDSDALRLSDGAGETVLEFVSGLESE